MRIKIEDKAIESVKREAEKEGISDPAILIMFPNFPRCPYCNFFPVKIDSSQRFQGQIRVSSEKGIGVYLEHAFRGFTRDMLVYVGPDGKYLLAQLVMSA